MVSVVAESRDSQVVEDAVRQIREFRSEHGSERRSETRHPYPNLVRITPVDGDLAPIHEPMYVAGKDLAKKGIGFFHTSPLPFRRVVASLQHHEGWTHFLVDISWCRFLQPGWYDSGGRFIKIVNWADDEIIATN